ncbi:site-specific recombinase XerD [Rhizobium laguerreae]|uniref:Site-specific recombinase XerD n=1 Tax=Rhizobium laguerreae TaxID=1076926 RepID=A0ABR6GCB0_9HYPH|nr:tyrosine-type recombinase/integrase [Rhizobium laguerreae]MBB3163218.1 site-specific recombinase XerD [Rhizobium laguerreae]NKM16265.1 tyrosine-type recombinase/integrase [Rhizobium laguerreae]OOO42948.1 integrase [Rhizobium laguerreae]
MTILPVENTILPQIINDWPHQDCARCVVSMMTDQGYSAKSIRSTIQTISAFVEWKKDCRNGEPTVVLYDDIDRFIESRAAAATLRHGERRSIQHLRAKLIEVGVVYQAPPAAHPIDDLTGRFAIDLRRRGYAAPTISAHLRYSRQFLRALWIDRSGIAHLQYDDIRDYLAGQFERHTAATSKIISSRLRVFLQFCWNAGVIELDLAQAVPMVKNHRLSSLPSFMSVAQLDQVLAACDRATVAGRRDFAILMLMSRLGLRAKEVALLSLDDIDWHRGIVQVHGKGGRVAAMPLPQDVGAAIADYVVDGRPSSGARTIFHRVETPCTPFSNATPVILIARRALKRAKITGLRSHHAHIFRHTFATMAIRSGVSLTELAQVLRHKQPDTTRIYAKLDTEGLRSLARPWLGASL